MENLNTNEIYERLSNAATIYFDRNYSSASCCQNLIAKGVKEIFLSKNYSNSIIKNITKLLISAGYKVVLETNEITWKPDSNTGICAGFVFQKM